MMQEPNAKPSPFMVGLAAAATVAAAAGAVAGLIMAAKRIPHETAAPTGPLIAHGWWDADDSSALAYAHPAVLFVDTASGSIVDSWDRRTRTRVPHPVVHRSHEWPSSALIVLDAVTGDLLHTVTASQSTL